MKSKAMKMFILLQKPNLQVTGRYRIGKVHSVQLTVRALGEPVEGGERSATR